MTLCWRFATGEALLLQLAADSLKMSGSEGALQGPNVAPGQAVPSRKIGPFTQSALVRVLKRSCVSIACALVQALRPSLCFT